MTSAAAVHVQEQAAPAAAAPVVMLSGVSKRFTVRRSIRGFLRDRGRAVTSYAVRDVSWQVCEGEFFGLLGPNGAGKTTLMRMLATLTLPDEGEARVLGHDVVNQAAMVRGLVALVLGDERGLYWRLSATENLRLFAVLHGLHGAALHNRVAEVLEIVGLSGTGAAGASGGRHQLVGTFSSGMRQRLLIARALLSRPRVLLLDEPTRSLDPVSARDFRRFLRDDIATGAACTVVLATHSAEEAFGLCDRVGILDHGRLLAQGPAHELAEAMDRDRYDAWTRTVSNSTWSALELRGDLRRLAVSQPDRDGWIRVELSIPGGTSRAAAVLDSLVRGGVSMGRFERVPVALADLIEQVVATGGGAGVGPGCGAADGSVSGSRAGGAESRDA